MTEKDVIQLLAKHSDHQKRYEVMVPNCYTSYDNEADFFGIRRSGFCDEFEIKVSRSDFLADAKKRVAYRECEKDEWGWKQQGLEFAPYTKWKRDALRAGELEANYFWYVVVEGICKLEEVPDFAGLIEVPAPDSCRSWLRVLKHPARLHKEKLSYEKRYRYARKGCFRFWNVYLSEAAA